MILSVMVLAAYTIVGHGLDTGTYLELTVKSLWPFFMIVLLVATPKEARNVLIAGGAALVAQTFLLLPAQIAQASAVFKGAGISLRCAGMSPERGGVLLCIFGGFSWQTVYTYAMAAPVFLSLYLLAPKSQKALRHFSMVIFVVLAASIILGGYLRGVMALALGVAVVLQTTTGLVKKRYIRWAVGCTIAFLILFLLMKYTPGGRQAMDRIMRYDEDGSIAVRTGLYGPALAAFFENPLFGWGLYYDEQYQTPNGAFMDGHAGILYIAASLGVVFLLPLILLLWKLWAALSALSSPRLTPIEKALITGFKGVFIVYIAEVIIEGSVFGNIPCDFILWTVAGLVTVWGYWSKRGQYDKFIA